MDPTDDDQKRRMLQAIYEMHTPTSSDLAETLKTSREAAVQIQEQLRAEGLLDYPKSYNRGFIVTEKGRQWLQGDQATNG